MAEGMLSLAWNNHSSTFGHMLSTVRDSELYTDVTIACDGKFYPAHKLVLSTCSDYFYKIFERTPCKHPVIVIKDVACKNMEALLNYMYAGVVSVSQSDLAQLIRAAELLEIKGLAVPDEPPSGTKRSVQTRDTSVDGSSSNPKKLRREDKRTLNQVEAPCIDSSVPSSQSSSKKDDGQGEQMNSNDIFNNKMNQRQSHSECRQERKENLGYSRRSEELGTDNGQDHLNPEGRSQNEVANESAIKEEKVEPDESEAAEMGFEYESLVTDLVGSEEGTKEHSSASDTSFNHSLNAESYSAEAGPSGLQPWPVLAEGGEASGVSQGYAGGSLPLASHPGQQPHQMQHMVLESSDMNGGNLIVPGTISQRLHRCPYCPYAADFNYLLQRHVRTHTGEKPYCCPQCSYRASRKDSLKQHMTTHLPPAKLE